MKKTKLLLVLSAIVMLASTSAFAQGKYGPDSADCVKYLNFYRDYYRQQNYVDAAINWRKAFELCPPAASQNMFIHGRTIMKYLIDNFKGDESLKQRMVDTLIKISEIRGQYYPSRKLISDEGKAFDMIQYFASDDRRVYDALDEIIATAGDEVNPDLIVAKMDRARLLYEAKVINEEEVLATYSKYSPMLDAIVKDDPSDENKTRQKIFENAFIISGVANCDNLISVFQPRFDAAPTDTALVQTIVKTLSDANCLDSDLFLKSVIALHQLNPSYSSARSLYRLHGSRNEHEEALKYLQEAIDNPESGDMEDGDMLFEMATYYFKNMENSAKAVSCAKLAMEKNPALSGKVYLLIGTIWYQVKCTGNEIEQRAKFWVATDYLTRAKSADPSLDSEVEELLRNCRSYYPKTEDAFMYDLVDGNSYSISCGGMSATTTVRTQK